MIEIKDIEKLAELSRINISNEEKEVFAGEIESILNYVDQIKLATGEAGRAISLEEGGSSEKTIIAMIQGSLAKT